MTGVNQHIIEKVKMFVKEECEKDSSKYGKEVYEAHFLPTAKHAEDLAKKIGADVDVVVLSALMHDIGSIIFGREYHHITGAKIAEDKLLEFGYEKEKIEKVKKCILNHRGSVKNKSESIEEQILKDADALDSFDRIEGLFNAALVHEKLDQFQARASVKQKLTNSYDKLSYQAKGIAKTKFEAAMLLLD